MKNNKDLNLFKKIFYTILIFFLLAFDQLTKEIMFIKSNATIGYSIAPFNNNFLLFTYVENHGGIFGIFQGHIKVFTILSVFLIIYVIYSEYKNIVNYSTLTQIGICFLTAGAMGNMVDRFFRGYVIDMINFQYIWKFIFNVADTYIHIGVYLIIINYIICKIKRRK